MLPSLLDPLFAALTTLPGVGPKLEKLYRRLFGREDAPARVIDLLFHLPNGTLDRHRPSPPNRPRVPYQIYTSDETGDLVLTYFHAKRDYLEKLLPVGELR